MKNIFISVIIPAYNREHSLPAAIKSVEDQIVDNWELLVIDDGSTDGTKKLFQNNKNNRITYLYQENQGVAAARNHGAKNARGEYLLFLDSDDVLLPGLFDRLSKILDQNFDLICWEVLKRIDGKESHWKPQKLSGLYNGINASFLAGSVLYKKKVFWEVGGYDPHISFGENYELGLRLSQLKKIKIKIIHEPFLRYVIESKERTSNSLENRLSSYLYQIKKHQNLFDENPKDHAELDYHVGFVLEKLDKKKAALQHFKKAWKNNPYYMRTYLKILCLYLLK